MPKLSVYICERKDGARTKDEILPGAIGRGFTLAYSDDDRVLTVDDLFDKVRDKYKRFFPNAPKLEIDHLRDARDMINCEGGVLDSEDLVKDIFKPEDNLLVYRMPLPATPALRTFREDSVAPTSAAAGPAKRSRVRPAPPLFNATVQPAAKRRKLADDGVMSSVEREMTGEVERRNDGERQGSVIIANSQRSPQEQTNTYGSPMSLSACRPSLAGHDDQVHTISDSPSRGNRHVRGTSTPKSESPIADDNMVYSVPISRCSPATTQAGSQDESVRPASTRRSQSAVRSEVVDSTATPGPRRHDSRTPEASLAQRTPEAQVQRPITTGAQVYSADVRAQSQDRRASKSVWDVPSDVEESSQTPRSRRAIQARQQRARSGQFTSEKATSTLSGPACSSNVQKGNGDHVASSRNILNSANVELPRITANDVSRNEPSDDVDMDITLPGLSEFDAQTEAQESEALEANRSERNRRGAKNAEQESKRKLALEAAESRKRELEAERAEQGRVEQEKAKATDARERTNSLAAQKLDSSLRAQRLLSSGLAEHGNRTPGFSTAPIPSSSSTRKSALRTPSASQGTPSRAVQDRKSSTSNVSSNNARSVSFSDDIPADRTAPVPVPTSATAPKATSPQVTSPNTSSSKSTAAKDTSSVVPAVTKGQNQNPTSAKTVNPKKGSKTATPARAILSMFDNWESMKVPPAFVAMQAMKAAKPNSKPNTPTTLTRKSATSALKPVATPSKASAKRSPPTISATKTAKKSTPPLEDDESEEDEESEEEEEEESEKETPSDEDQEIVSTKDKNPTRDEEAQSASEGEKDDGEDREHSKPASQDASDIEMDDGDADEDNTLDTTVPPKHGRPQPSSFTKHKQSTHDGNVQTEQARDSDVSDEQSESDTGSDDDDGDAAPEDGHLHQSSDLPMQDQDRQADAAKRKSSDAEQQTALTNPRRAGSVSSGKSVASNEHGVPSRSVSLTDSRSPARELQSSGEEDESATESESGSDDDRDELVQDKTEGGKTEAEQDDTNETTGSTASDSEDELLHVTESLKATPTTTKNNSTQEQGAGKGRQQSKEIVHGSSDASTSDDGQLLPVLKRSDEKKSSPQELTDSASRQLQREATQSMEAYNSTQSTLDLKPVSMSQPNPGSSKALRTPVRSRPPMSSQYPSFSQLKSQGLDAARNKPTTKNPPYRNPTRELGSAIHFDEEQTESSASDEDSESDSSDSNSDTEGKTASQKQTVTSSGGKSRAAGAYKSLLKFKNNHK